MTNYLFTDYRDAIDLMFEVEVDNLVGIPHGIASNSVQISSEKCRSEDYNRMWIVSVR